MSGEIEIVAIFKSNPGKADRAQQVLDEMAAYIKANEPGTLRYHLSRETKGDAPTFVLLETYVHLFSPSQSSCSTDYWL